MLLRKQAKGNAWVDSQKDEPETHRRCEKIYADTRSSNGQSRIHGRAVKSFRESLWAAGECPEWGTASPVQEAEELSGALSMEAQCG